MVDSEHHLGGGGGNFHNFRFFFVRAPKSSLKFSSLGEEIQKIFPILHFVVSDTNTSIPN